MFIVLFKLPLSNKIIVKVLDYPVNAHYFCLYLVVAVAEDISDSCFERSLRLVAKAVLFLSIIVI